MAGEWGGGGVEPFVLLSKGPRKAAKACSRAFIFWTALNLLKARKYWALELLLVLIDL